MSDVEIVVRCMNRDEVELAVRWAALEGWNPGLHDADSFYTADPNGFFVALLDDEPVGSISAVAYDDRFGFMGFYIVRNELRHRGIGIKLWNTALEYLGNRSVGGDGVVAMLDHYAESGFAIEHYNARFEGAGQSGGPPLADLSALPFEELEGYDRRHFPAPRGEFLKSWVSRPGTQGRAVLEGGRLAGYGVIRPCQRGFKIAPLFADSAEIAEALFASLSACAAGAPVFLDIPVCNAAAQELVQRHGMAKVFETARIYKNGAPRLPLDRIYGITSFELG